MLVPDDHEGVQWFPNFMPISISQEDYSHDESFLYEFHLTDV
jgi:hypothetical protein